VRSSIEFPLAVWTVPIDVVQEQLGCLDSIECVAPMSHFDATIDQAVARRQRDGNSGVVPLNPDRPGGIRLEPDANRHAHFARGPVDVRGQHVTMLVDPKVRVGRIQLQPRCLRNPREQPLEHRFHEWIGVTRRRVPQLVVAPGEASGPCDLACIFVQKSARRVRQELLEDAISRVGESCPAHRGSLPVIVTERARPAVFDFAVAPKRTERSRYTSTVTAVGATRHEQLLESWASATDGLSSIMARASRSARQRVDAASQREESLRDVAAGVAAPLLTGYVLWVLRHAQESRLDRLYFLSRDGEILLDIARRLRDCVSSSCQLRYLYASRHAWWVPAASAALSEHLEPFIPDHGHLSLRAILVRLCLESDGVSDDLASVGFAVDDASRDLTRQERQTLRAIVREGTLRRVIERSTASKRELLRQYLKQEGLFDAGDWALVDVGWRGTLQKALGVMLQEANAATARGFYIGIITDAFLGVTAPSLEASCGRRDAYLFDERTPRRVPTSGPTAAHMIELFCTGTEGPVVGYERRGEQVTPVLAACANRPALDAGLPLMRETILRFAEELSRSRELLVDRKGDVRAACAAILDDFWHTPLPAAAAAWAAFPFELNLARADSTLFASRFSWRDVALAFRSGVAGTGAWRPWVAGSLAITPPAVRLALHASAAIGRPARRVLRPLKNAIYTSGD